MVVLAAMAALCALCLLGGVSPGFVIDAISLAGELFVGGRMPRKATLRSVDAPIAESRSSFSGRFRFRAFCFRNHRGRVARHSRPRRFRKPMP